VGDWSQQHRAGDNLQVAAAAPMGSNHGLRYTYTSCAIAVGSACDCVTDQGALLGCHTVLSPAHALQRGTYVFYFFRASIDAIA
jgi:hypothetical protein